MEKCELVALKLKELQFNGKTAQVGTSIGIAMYPADGTTAAELIKNADTAMYEAKHAGKNTCRFFVPEAVRAAAVEAS